MRIKFINFTLTLLPSRFSTKLLAGHCEIFDSFTILSILIPYIEDFHLCLNTHYSEADLN